MHTFHENCSLVSSELKCKILQILPPQYPSLILQINNVNNCFSCLLRTSINDKSNAIEWKKEFELLSLTTYTVSGSFPENTQKLVFKKRYHCHHNTRPNSKTIKPHAKHTSCTVRFTITVKQSNMK
ncbi:uncharacterized protein LOC111034970, partial [Myzus persicae]|uniref:uncharacterized protein LOC111034970 n=1 Tax=Myzus persicae TaxID=13164 RepID=UPI000B93153C